MNQPHSISRAGPDQEQDQRQRHLSRRGRHPHVGRGGCAVRQIREPFDRREKTPVGEGVPYGRMGLPEDHTGAAVFLACSDSDYVVAQTLNVDGGQWMS